MSSSSSDEAKPTFAALLEALELSLAFTPVAAFRMALLDSSLNASAADMRMLLEMLLLFSDSDSEAAVEADADLLSLAAALALSLELPRWLLLCETESDMDSDVETLVWLRSLVLAETDVARAVAPEATAAGAAPPATAAVTLADTTPRALVAAEAAVAVVDRALAEAEMDTLTDSEVDADERENTETDSLADPEALSDPEADSDSLSDSDSLVDLSPVNIMDRAHSSLVMHVRRARDDGRLDRELSQIGKADLLVIDELGFLPLDADGARLLFQVVSEAYERQSVVFTTNLEFSKWGAVFGDDQMAAAVIDRVVHHGRLLQFKGESYRVRHTLMQ